MPQRNNTRSRGGFTLMEMLLVLAILVVLMGLVGPRILGSQKKADISTTKTQLGMFKATLERFALDLRRFPSTEEGLIMLLEEPAEAEGTDNWDGPYLDGSEIPRDPWGNEYQYEYPPTRGKNDFPDIWSLGPDGQDGTDDDIVNWNKDDAEESPSGSSSSSSSGNSGGSRSTNE